MLNSREAFGDRLARRTVTKKRERLSFEVFWRKEGAASHRFFSVNEYAHLKNY